jgi:Transcriptional regulators
MATIREIAAACNVSISTVSNVFNDKSNVSDDTRQKILDKAKEMSYIPNYMAKNLKRKTTKTIGIITEDITVFNCAEIVDGINEFFDEQGYTFMLGNLRLYKKYSNDFYHKETYKKRVEAELDKMKARQVDGIIYIGAHCRKINYIPQHFPVPLVVAYSFTSHPNIPSVIFDDEEAAYQAVSALIKNGNRKIGVIAGEMFSLHTKERMKGYKRALKEAAIPFRKNLVQEGNWSKTQSIHACKNLMEEAVSGIFAMSDVMAGGVYEFTAKEEIEVGTDLDLIGFDDREAAQAYNPPLTTMALPLNRIGRKSAEIMTQILENGSDSIQTNIHKINCNLILRNSLRKPGNK